MRNTILQTNATPIYSFLSYITNKLSKEELSKPLRILDCGAGGQVPPLAVFIDQGFEAYGIDISNQQLERAKQYCDQRNLPVNLQIANIRKIPFKDKNFDFVYEHYTMCHLSKEETANAIREMNRVTKKQGLCFLGVISMDSCPKSLYGVEKSAGEFWNGDSRHTMFTDKEAANLVKDWDILSHEKRIIFHQSVSAQVTIQQWMELYDNQDFSNTEEDWRNLYDQRENMINYSHIYYILRKK